LTEILRISQLRPDRAVIKKAVKVLDAKGVVMYPTESSYALGVNALERTAVKKLFEIKGRSTNKPIPVIVPDLKTWEKYAYFNRRAERLVRVFMPGPLTLALRKRSSVPNELNRFAIAARIPSHPVALALVCKAKYPVTSTSANIAGQPPAYSPKSVSRSLRSRIDLILDAGRLKRRRYSTIVDLTKHNGPVVIREGAIPTSTILRTLTRGEP